MSNEDDQEIRVKINLEQKNNRDALAKKIAGFANTVLYDTQEEAKLSAAQIRFNLQNKMLHAKQQAAEAAEDAYYLNITKENSELARKAGLPDETLQLQPDLFLYDLGAALSTAAITAASNALMQRIQYDFKDQHKQNHRLIREAENIIHDDTIDKNTKQNAKDIQDIYHDINHTLNNAQYLVPRLTPSAPKKQLEEKQSNEYEDTNECHPDNLCQFLAQLHSLGQLLNYHRQRHQLVREICAQQQHRLNQHAFFTHANKHSTHHINHVLNPFITHINRFTQGALNPSPDNTHATTIHRTEQSQMRQALINPYSLFSPSPYLANRLNPKFKRSNQDLRELLEKLHVLNPQTAQNSAMLQPR